MSSYTIYHNARCSNSRGALKILKERGIEPHIRFYLKEPPSEKELRTVLKKLQLKAIDIVRKNESLFKEKYKGKTLSDDEWIGILAENPVLIQRPIVIKDDTAVVARPASRVLDIL